jgi:hypothetical protein
MPYKMKLLKRFPIFSQKALASVCCLFAYLVLAVHDLIPHHHEEDIASHVHGHNHESTHHHHGSRSHTQLKSSHQNQECLLFVHHVNGEDCIISTSIIKKKLLADYCPADNILKNYLARYYVLRKYTVAKTHPLLFLHKYTEAPRGPPQA